MRTTRLVAAVGCTGLGGLVAATTLIARLRISVRHEAWVLVGFTSVALLGTLAVAGALIAGSINTWIRAGASADRADRPTHPGLQLVDRWIAPAMVTTVGLGMLLAMSGVDWIIGYLSVGVFAAWLMTFALLLQRERARALWGLLVLSVVAIGAGAVGLPSAARLWLDEPQLVAAGQQILAGESPTRAGSYQILSSSTDGTCAVMVTQHFVIDSFGVAYCEGGTGSPLLTRRFGDIYDYAQVD